MATFNLSHAISFLFFVVACFVLLKPDAAISTCKTLFFRQNEQMQISGMMSIEEYHHELRKVMGNPTLAHETEEPKEQDPQEHFKHYAQDPSLTSSESTNADPAQVTSPPAAFEEHHKFALLFLTMGNIPMIHIWNEWARGHEHEFSRIAISTKSWNQKLSGEVIKGWHLMPKISPAKRFDPSLTKNMLKLVSEALRNHDNKKMLFVSDSCVPTQPFSEFKRRLMATPYSIFAYNRWFEDVTLQNNTLVSRVLEADSPKWHRSNHPTRRITLPKTLPGTSTPSEDEPPTPDDDMTNVTSIITSGPPDQKGVQLLNTGQWLVLNRYDSRIAVREFDKFLDAYRRGLIPKPLTGDSSYIVHVVLFYHRRVAEQGPISFQMWLTNHYDHGNRPKCIEEKDLEYDMHAARAGNFLTARKVKFGAPNYRFPTVSPELLSSVLRKEGILPPEV